MDIISSSSNAFILLELLSNFTQIDIQFISIIYWTEQNHFLINNHFKSCKKSQYQNLNPINYQKQEQLSKLSKIQYINFKSIPCFNSQRMDFPSIPNKQGYKYIQSPVVHNFPSQKLLNNKSKNKLSINTIGNILARKQQSNQGSNSSDLQLSSVMTEKKFQVKNRNQKGLLNDRNKKQEKLQQMVIHVIPEVKNSSIDDGMMYNRSKYEDKQVIGNNKRSTQLDRKSSQQFAYYRTYFSPGKSSPIKISPSPSHKVTLNQDAFQKEKQMNQKEISTLKIQLKSYQDKIDHFNQQKEQWIHCKNRNEILQREYKILNQEFNKLKDQNLQILQNRWRSSDVYNVDLKDISSEDFAKKLMYEKRYSIDGKMVNNEILQKQQIKIQQQNISRLENEITNLNQKIQKISQQNERIKVSTPKKQPQKLQKQMISLRQRNLKLQQEKQSYVSNYKMLKNQREKESKQLKKKQEQIHQSLQELNKEMVSLSREKEQIQAENKRLKRRTQQLENQIQALNNKYSNVRFDYEEVVNHSLQTNHQFDYHNKNILKQVNYEQQYHQIAKKLSTLTQTYEQRIRLLNEQHQRQKSQIIRKQEQKIEFIEGKIRQLKDRIGQNQNQNKDYQDKLRRTQERYEQKIVKLQVKRKNIEEKMLNQQQKTNKHEQTIKKLQQKIGKLQIIIQVKEHQLSRKQSEIQQLIQKREQKWAQLVDLKHKYLQASQMILTGVNEKTLLKTEIHSLQKELHQKISNLNETILSMQQKQTQLKEQNQSLLFSKESEVKKQRVQIQGLLNEIVKLRHVKDQNYKLMEKQKSFMNINQTIVHLWAVKEAEYQNISQVLNILIKKNQER